MDVTILAVGSGRQLFKARCKFNMGSFHSGRAYVIQFLTTTLYKFDVQLRCTSCLQGGSGYPVGSLSTSQGKRRAVRFRDQEAEAGKRRCTRQVG